MSLDPGGRPGGELKFFIGLALAAVGIWLFFDSVRFTSGHHGLLSGAIGGHGKGGGRGHGGGGMGQTTSMGLLLVPLFTGVVALFFNVRQKWAWGLTGLGLIILAVEIVSRLRPHFDVKSSHAILMILLIAGGFGLMLRGYLDDRRKGTGDPPSQARKSG